MIPYSPLDSSLLCAEPFPEINRTDQPYPAGCVHELFEQQVSRSPEAVAVEQANRRLTYRQLNERANRIARVLQRRGVGREVLVGVALEQSLEAITAILAILKAGGAYVPLDRRWPRSRLAEILEKTRLPIAITGPGVEENIPASAQRIIVDSDLSMFSAESSTTPAFDCTLDSAAYVLWTSGSTGRSKGVVGVHRSIVNGLLAVTYAPDEICCLNASLTFGFHLANLFLPLMTGVPLIVLRQDEIRDIAQFIGCIERYSITRVSLVPQVCSQILDLPEAPGRLKKIRSVSLAGGALTPELLRRINQVMPQARILNAYSCTEVGTLVTRCEMPSTGNGSCGIVIGRPVANTRIYILDEQKQPAPTGVTGEIYVGARHLARGYLNEPGLTAERFFEAFGPSPIRLFRTGDLGRFRPDGEIEFRGRTDDMVKVRGYRIELLEVEFALAKHPHVREAAVTAREFSNNLRLVAYVVSDATAPSVRDLRTFLGERLPDYMIPSIFVFLDRLPLTENGKVNRQALPQPDAVPSSRRDDVELPRDSAEAAIAAIWRSVLSLNEVGIYDNFLELGGDSLLAQEAISHINDQFGIELSLEMYFDRPTIAELVQYVRDSGDPGVHTAQVPNL